MAKPTQAEINRELLLLETIRPSLPPSAFGDDNAGACAAQIRVLREGMTESAIYDAWPADMNPNDRQLEHKLNAALDARRWRDGQSREIPSQSWLPLYERATGRHIEARRKALK